MELEVPLLSQDEFFRHLELQSVHILKSVKFTYRQVLKERLRATTKRDSLTLPPRSCDNKPIRNNNYESPKKTAKVLNEKQEAPLTLLSPKTRRKILNRQRAWKKSSTTATQTLRSHRDTFKNLVQDYEALPIKVQQQEPPVQSCQTFQENVSQLLAEKSVASSLILERNCYWTDKTCPANEPKTKFYIKYRRQKSKKLEEMGDPQRLVLPGSFPLGPVTQESQPLHESHLPHLWIPNSKTMTEESTKTPPLRVVVKLKGQSEGYYCPICDRTFASKSGKYYHEDNAHGICKICQRLYDVAWAKGKTKWETCEKCTKMMMPAKRPREEVSCVTRSSDDLRCDFCTKTFSDREAMIKHVMYWHSNQMHKVDLAKFANSEALES